METFTSRFFFPTSGVEVSLAHANRGKSWDLSSNDKGLQFVTIIIHCDLYHLSLDPRTQSCLVPYTSQVHGGRESQDLPGVVYWGGTVCNRNVEPTYYPYLFTP